MDVPNRCPSGGADRPTPSTVRLKPHTDIGRSVKRVTEPRGLAAALEPHAVFGVMRRLDQETMSRVPPVLTSGGHRGIAFGLQFQNIAAGAGDQCRACVVGLHRVRSARPVRALEPSHPRIAGMYPCGSTFGGQTGVKRRSALSIRALKAPETLGFGCGAEGI